MVVEVKTGRIMAAADWPSVDPNDLDSASGSATAARASSRAPFEPGSVMKVATFASLLDQGKITPETQVTVPGIYTEGLPAGSSIKDAWAHGDLHLHRDRRARELVEHRHGDPGAEAQQADASRLPRGVRLQLRHRGRLPRRVAAARCCPMDQTDAITNLTQQFGQGMSATSAQIASLYQTIGNGGVRMPLTLVEGCERPDGTWTEKPSTEGTRVVSEAAADTTVQMMEVVAHQGSLQGRARASPATGSRRRPEPPRSPRTAATASDRIVSVAGLIPAGDPQYAIVVTFAKPDTMRTSAAAAPAFNAIMKQVIKTFRITPQTNGAPSLPTVW